ncbi:MAG: hypothetical protein WBE91_16825 [Steroidobacteraceae bacterium]
MDRNSVRNAWRLFNLRESPFFQEPLQAGTRYPMSLFVGRTADTDRLLAKIERSPGSSRQTVRGAVGVGKSTLAQHVKAEIADAGVLSTPAAVSVSSALTLDQLCALALRSVLDALLGAAPKQAAARRKVEGAEAVRQASQMVRVYQATTGSSGGLSVAGLGGSAGRSTTLVTPATATPSLMIQGLLQQLIHLAREVLGTRAILVHLNNLENLTESNAERAAQLLRDIRDICFMVEGYHWLVVGTDEAVRTVIDAQPQLATVFSTPPALSSLTQEEFLELLRRRYAALRVEESRPARPPVEPEAAGALYRIFDGDLRGSLAALDEATGEMLGFGADGPDAPLTQEDMMPFLERWYSLRAEERLGKSSAALLPKLARSHAHKPFTLRALRDEIMKGRNNAAARRFLEELLRFGYIREHPERLQSGGRPAAQYVLAGAAKLATSLRV